MSDECKCSDECACHISGEYGGIENSVGEAGKVPYIKECKCDKKCKSVIKVVDEN
ncbi:MAG TPA: hypothetical protein VI911_00805 [Patescibacteria group bacterium]|nr:hypothetical protein [Patescibacteria group bacterium]